MAAKPAKKSAKKSAKKPSKAPAKKAAKKPAKKAGKKKAAASASSDADESSETDKKTGAADSGKAKSGATGGKALSLEINMGHVFALRPRVTTSFKAGDFATAKHQLRDESYADIREAAQAVVDKALELTHGAPNRGRGRRF